MTPIDWSAEMDARLLALRRDGMPWHVVAKTLGVGRNSVIERARRLGVPAQNYFSPAAQPPARTVEHVDRRPYPPGHPLTWQAITAGTVLAGERYPYPVYL